MHLFRYFPYQMLNKPDKVLTGVGREWDDRKKASIPSGRQDSTIRVHK